MPTFNPAQPYPNQSPALFPDANHANMARIQDQFLVDHQFNDTETSPPNNDGWHKVVHWVQQSGQIDPLNPAAAAPNNAGGPVITWEQEDVYSVPRIWRRAANAGNVHTLDSETEIRGTWPASLTPTMVVTPPPNTWGTITLWSTAANIVMSANFVHDVVTAVSVFTTYGSPVLSTSTRQDVIPSPLYIGSFLSNRSTIFASVTTGFEGTYQYRVLYRYI